MMTRQIAIGLGLTGIILFSTKAIFAKLAYQYEVDAINLLLLRMTFSLPFYLFFAFYKNQEKVTAAKEMRRFIDGQNLWVYVRDFINRTYRGSNLVEKEKDPLSIDIELSIDAKTSFRQFFGNTTNQFSTKLCEMNSGDPIRCIFDNRVDFKQTDYEVVNQHHPLIRFAANNTSLEDFHRVVATKIEIPKHLDLARGVYLSITKSWRTSGAKKIENLVYRSINISTGEIISEKNSELLVMLAASEGKNWHTAVSDIDPNKSIACYHQLESLIDEQFDEYCQQMKLENEDRIDYLIATLNDRMNETKRRLISKTGVAATVSSE